MMAQRKVTDNNTRRVKRQRDLMSASYRTPPYVLVLFFSNTNGPRNTIKNHVLR